MTDWYWVRHGPTHAKTFVGWTDLPADLSDTDQIARLDAYLPNEAIVVSSDLSRCVTTGDAIQGTRTRLPHDPNLREFNFGAWENKTFDQVSQTHPELCRAYWETPGDVRPPDGESWNEAAARVAPVVDRLSRSHASIIVVAHFGVILTQVARALGCEPYDALAHRIDNYSVTHLSFDKGQWTVHTINHLP